MEFGRKGDAKRAMKLAWSKGITLKQAWKIVKKGRKKRSGPMRKRKSKRRNLRRCKRVYKKKRSRRKGRRTNPDAKKAMKLAWKRNIPLKQAWRIVKRQRKN